MGALLTVVSAASLVACGGSSSTGPAWSGTPVAAATVNATPSLQFTPNTVTIVAGGTVTVDFGTVAHDVFFDSNPSGAPASITVPTSNASRTLTFNQPGAFVYNCHVHPGMQGIVVVK